MLLSASRPSSGGREERAISATDVCATGVVAYELLVGHPPLLGPDYRRQHMEDKPESIPGIPVKLQSLVGQCLYKGPASTTDNS